MTDTPSINIPSDPLEQPILEKLLAIRDGLYLLKQDKSTYIRSKDAFSFYEQVTEQVRALNELRGSQMPEHHRVDYVLDDCFQLISLVFLTVGRNLEAPAVYSMASTVKSPDNAITSSGPVKREQQLLAKLFKPSPALI
ncbi:Plasma membrane sulfite pump involved in sulfite metabolism [Ascosphaera pollenicola]|nr:Plasma membrane sulfite pump involved in sulfite metabolism [Ascosphaera pollenicola]